MKQEVKPLFVRDISWLSFNERVLQEAMDTSNDLFDRLRFLGIFSNNQDEFFRVRVAALNNMKRLGKSAKMHLEENPSKILKKISEKVRALSRTFDKTYHAIIKEMADHRIHIKNEKQLHPEQERYITEYFNSSVRTHIVPLMIESIPKFPYLKDDAIYLACVLGNESHSLIHRYALIEIPTKSLQRFIKLPSTDGNMDIILLEDIIRYNLPQIFAPFGFNKFLGYIVKVTRDAEFTLTDNDVNRNIIEQLEKAIKNRKKGKATRFVYDKSIDPGLLDFLVRRLQIDSKDSLIPGGRIHNFKDFMNFPEDIFKAISFKEAKPAFNHPALKQPCRIMGKMDEEDILLHFPYHKFDPVIDVLREAAIDPYVESIKITCYRLAKDSKIMNALVNAARNGKQVTAVLELTARFDEEANMMWKNKLEEEGVKVILGVPNQKVHAKICSIKKRTFNKIKYYGFISTGNFNENTSRIYSDACLLTSNKQILADVNKTFQYLENHQKGLAPLLNCKLLPVSPINTRNIWIDLVNKEISLAKKNKTASIIIKVNSLVDEALIMKLYEAAEVGVKIDLIVRGVFCPLPQQKKLHNNIRAISIVDGYLEHARIFVFNNDGKPKLFISSADWMLRNLDHRIEASVPILDENLKNEIIDLLHIQLSDNVKARILDNKQANLYIEKGIDEPEIRSQIAIYDYLHSRAMAYYLHPNPNSKPKKEKTIDIIF